MLLRRLLERIQVAPPHRLGDRIVWPQLLLQLLLHEERALGDPSHEQLHNDRQLVGSELEAERHCRSLRRLPDGLHQLRVRVRILQVHRLDLSDVEEVPRVLRIGPGLREGRLLHQLQSLVVQVVRQVVPEQQVQKRGLAHGVVPEARRPVRREELWPELRDAADALVRQREVEVRARTEDVQRPAVERLEPGHEGAGNLECLLLLLLVAKPDQQEQGREGLHFRRAGLRQLRELDLCGRSLFLLRHGSVCGHHGQVERLAGAARIDRLVEQRLEHLRRHGAPQLGEGADRATHAPRVAIRDARNDVLEVGAEELYEKRPGVLGRRLLSVLLLRRVLVLHLDVLFRRFLRHGCGPRAAMRGGR
mmetsp:Transcript_70213/g.205886  ORF Transcript_70213/g.205886 Transcript_70213/m.205886 type:complete len:363 (+) Transcript_70213:572-1660(+)